MSITKNRLEAVTCCCPPPEGKTIIVSAGCKVHGITFYACGIPSEYEDPALAQSSISRGGKSGVAKLANGGYR